MAAYSINFKLWANARQKVEKPDSAALMALGLTVCEECKKLVKLEDFLLKEGRQQIAAAFRERGNAVPDFNLTEIDLKPVKVYNT